MRKIIAACGFLLLASSQAAFAQSLNIRQTATCGTGTYNTPFLTVDPTGTLCTSAGGGGGGGTSSNFGSAFPAAGTAAGAKDISGNMASLNLDASGNLKVTGGGTSATDASAFTTGTTSIVPTGGLFNDSATLTSGQIGAPRLTTKRAQIVDVDTSGNALYSALTASIPAGTNIIGKVGIDQTTPGTTNGVQVNAALPAGTNLMGKVGIDQTTPGTTNGVQDAATSATGSAVSSKAIYAGANSGGNLTGIIQADTSVKIDVNTATTTQLVALASSKKIYVTAWDVISGGTGNIKLVYGTGSNCGTGTTDVTANYNLTAQAGIAKGSGLGPVLVIPASQALCVTTSAAVQMSGSLAYTQF